MISIIRIYHIHLHHHGPAFSLSTSIQLIGLVIYSNSRYKGCVNIRTRPWTFANDKRLSFLGSNQLAPCLVYQNVQLGSQPHGVAALYMSP